ncbi:MAG TPA: GGDEF domain-containing protein [Candidatus Limnocylindria bacterium]|nr:GGDEF domain-containing protein [Candidatus Limnocylindria bacterium]
MTPSAPLEQLTIEMLQARIADLERERDLYAQQNAELLILQQVFTTMNSTMDVDDILAMVLRGICEALRAARVVLFDVHEGTARRYLEAEPGTYQVLSSPQPDAFVATATLQAMISGQQDFAMGIADDGESPLHDASGAYCVLPLVSRGAVRGLLYVDSTAEELSEIQLQLLFDFGAQAAMALENSRLYHETQRLLAETQALASTDALTGLLNRRALIEHLERELWNAERYHSALTLAFFDLDDLKRINDEGGHAAGDDALRRFAGALKHTCRKGDIVARYGGDEFILVITQADHKAAEIAAKRVYEHVHAEGLRCSAGLAIYPLDGTDPQTLINSADRALYSAKRTGKDQFAFSSIIVN